MADSERVKAIQRKMERKIERECEIYSDRYLHMEIESDRERQIAIDRNRRKREREKERGGRWTSDRKSRCLLLSLEEHV